MSQQSQNFASEDTIRILVADYQAIVRHGIASLLTVTPGFEVAAIAANGIEAVELALRLQPDVVVMDVGMPVLNGMDAAQKIKAAAGTIRILMLSAYDGEDLVMNSIACGADGYLLKTAGPERLFEGIRALGRGTTTFYSPSLSPETIQMLREKIDHALREGRDLTPREREVLRLIAEGKSHQEIAELLMVSVRTVDTHRNNLMQKLKIHDTVALVRYAVRAGLVYI